MTESLVDLLVTAIPRLAIWERFRGMDEVGAFALSTDDSLSTLVASAAPSTWLVENPDARFWPPDWPFEDISDPGLDAPGNLLEQTCRLASSKSVAASFAGEQLRAHIDSSFSSLVRSLAVLRSQRFFASSTALLVAGTTPTPSMLGRATEAIAQLNGEDVLLAWRRYWNINSE